MTRTEEIREQYPAICDYLVGLQEQLRAWGFTFDYKVELRPLTAQEQQAMMEAYINWRDGKTDYETYYAVTDKIICPERNT